MAIAMPPVRPSVPHFSSGPCAKRPGWSLQTLTDAVLGRSHRSKIGKAKLKRAIDLTREVLEAPADYRIGIVQPPTPAPSKWRCGRCSARGRSPCCPGNPSAKAGSDVQKELKLK